MPLTEPFNEYAERYDDWYDRRPLVYQAELRAVKRALPRRGHGLEVGVGTGRFAVHLGVRTGVEPSAAMRDRARLRGVEAVAAREPVREGSGEGGFPVIRGEREKSG